MTKIIQPRQYQTDSVNGIIRKISEKHKRILFQLSTGGGKTVILTLLLSRYLSRYPSHKCIILVHREELKEQAEATLKSAGINNVSVRMVKGFINQIKKEHIDYDLIILDEAHRGEHNSVFTHYPESLIIGLTATPISATKKEPLKSRFETLVTGIAINDLIDMGYLCPPIHYSAKNAVDKKNFKKSGGEYTLQSVAQEYSRPKLIDAVVDAYEKYGRGKKTVIFNTTVEHAQKVDAAFKDRGYNSKCLNDENRKDTLIWLRNTPDAILNNCEILTTGFDETSLEVVIFNRSTKSLTTWLQCCGRGARLHPGKEYFTIIDMGDNIKGEGHDYWNAKHDWQYRFTNPEIPGEGPPPMKECPNDECGALIFMSSTKCPHCGHLMPREVVFSDMCIELNILPDYALKKNSTIALENAIKESANKIAKLQFDQAEKIELLETAITEIYRTSSFQINRYVLKHLLEIYGAQYRIYSPRERITKF